MAHAEYPIVRTDSDLKKGSSCLYCCIWNIKDCLHCCSKTKKKPEKVAPIVMTQPVPFTDPPRPGFKVAPQPPEGKGPSIVFDKGVEEKDLPVGFYVSDLTHNHQVPFAYPS